MDFQEEPSLLAQTKDPNGTANKFLEEWRSASLYVRLMLIVYLAIGAWGGLVGSYMIIRDFHTPIAYAVSFLLLEPIGLCCLFSLIALLMPASLIGRIFAHSVGRARVAIAIIGMLFLTVVIGGLSWAIWEWIRFKME